jgi:hypothetical protein
MWTFAELVKSSYAQHFSRKMSFAVRQFGVQIIIHHIGDELSKNLTSKGVAISATYLLSHCLQIRSFKYLEMCKSFVSLT